MVCRKTKGRVVDEDIVIRKLNISMTMEKGDVGGLNTRGVMVTKTNLPADGNA